MSGRDQDNHRIRSAHHDRLDPETADRVMAREFRTPTPRRDAPAIVQEPGESVLVVRARLAGAAVTPRALAIACPRCGVASGDYCTTGIPSVCTPRVLASLRVPA